MKIRARSTTRRLANPLMAGALGLAACAAVLEPAAAAQPGETPAPAVQPQQPHTGEVTDAKLRQFATAASNVKVIQEQYAAEAQTLQASAEEEMVASVEGAGMTVAEFRALFERIQNDPALAQRLDALATGGSES